MRPPDGIELDVPEWLHDALCVVLRDLLGDRSHPLTLTHSAADDLGYIEVHEAGPGWGSFSVRRGQQSCDLLVEIAEGLQSELCETAAGWGEKLPACPGHSHGLIAITATGEAWWKCPATGAAVARIGALAGRNPA